MREFLKNALIMLGCTAACIFALWCIGHRHCESCTVWTGPDTYEPGFIWRGFDSGTTRTCTPCREAKSPEAKAVCKEP